MSGASPSISQSTRNWMMSNPSVLRALPHPDERWQLADVEFGRRQLIMLRRRNLITKVGTDDNEASYYRTREHYWTDIENGYDESRFLECGHRAFRTVDLDSEHPYSCLNDDCDARYRRSAIEAAVNGGESA